MREQPVKVCFVNSHSKYCLSSGVRAFSLTELVVVIGIVALLGCFAIGGIQKAYEATRRTREIHAARTLIIAFHRYATEHNGTFFNGNDNKEDAWNLDGKKLSHMPPIATRYPWRLLPYVDGGLTDAILINQSIDEARDGTGKFDDYSVSLLPSLAMNITYIGSEREVLNKKGEVLGYNPHTVNRIEQVQNPNDLIVFVSGGAFDAPPDDTTATPRKYHGYWYAKAPYDTMTGSTWPDEADPRFPLLGNVHFRWDGKAVVASLSGSVSLLTPKQLRDMRRWANNAAVANDPNWAPLWNTSH